jgi:hypothetical protein
MMAKLTDEDYAEMAADYAAIPPRPDEIDGEITIGSAELPSGRPAGRSIVRGKTPTTFLGVLAVYALATTFNARGALGR